MPKGGFGGMPANMNNLMKQAKKMQEKMEQAQEEMKSRVIEVTAGGGMVKISISGNKEIKELTIDPAAVDPDDIEMLQDLLISGVNEAIRQVEELSNKEMGKFMPQGMNLPF